MSLFENAGTKIKSWAFGLFIVEAIAAFISGLVTMFSDDDQFFIGLLVIVAGFFVAFITSLFLSAFGELVESSTENKDINAKILAKLEAQEKTAAAQLKDAAVTNSETWHCTACGAENSKNYYQCKKCGKQRSGK